jgi:DNA-binding IclR family transcriptional regulator
MPLRNLPQPIRFIQQRPFRVQDLRTLAHLFRLTIHFVQFTIQDGDGMLHLIQMKPRTGRDNQADKGKRADHAACSCAKRSMLRSRAERARGLALHSASCGRRARGVSK